MLIDGSDAGPKQPYSVVFLPVGLSVPMSLFLTHSQRVGGRVGTGDSIAQIGIALGFVNTQWSPLCWHMVQICPGGGGTVLRA